MTPEARAAAYRFEERIWEAPAVAYVTRGIFASGTVWVSVQFDAHPPIGEAEAFLASLGARDVTPKSSEGNGWLIGTVTWEGLEISVTVHHASVEGSGEAGA